MLTRCERSLLPACSLETSLGGLLASQSRGSSAQCGWEGLSRRGQSFQAFSVVWSASWGLCRGGQTPKPPDPPGPAHLVQLQPPGRFSDLDICTGYRHVLMEGIPFSAGIVAYGLSCSEECGIFPDQRLNLCLLHWQADSLPLRHLGNPLA